MATREEQTGKRDLSLSQWIRKNLPDSSTGYLVSDLDFILYDKTNKRIMLIEAKTRNAAPRKWQSELFNLIDKMMRISAPEVGIEYKGWHLIQLESLDPSKGKIYLDGHEIDEQDLIFYLSMRG